MSDWVKVQVLIPPLQDFPRSHNQLALVSLNTVKFYTSFILSPSLVSTDDSRYLLVSYIFNAIAFSLALDFCKALLRAAYMYVYNEKLEHTCTGYCADSLILHSSHSNI